MRSTSLNSATVLFPRIFFVYQRINVNGFHFPNPVWQFSIAFRPNISYENINFERSKIYHHTKYMFGLRSNCYYMNFKINLTV